MAKKEVALEIRIERELKESLRSLAKSRGEGMSEFVRGVLWDVVDGEQVFRHVNGDDK